MGGGVVAQMIAHLCVRELHVRVRHRPSYPESAIDSGLGGVAGGGSAAVLLGRPATARELHVRPSYAHQEVQCWSIPVREAAA